MKPHKKLSIYTWILLAFLAIGIVSGLILVRDRHLIEVEQERVENIIDYDGLIRSNSYERVWNHRIGYL